MTLTCDQRKLSGSVDGLVPAAQLCGLGVQFPQKLVSGRLPHEWQDGWRTGDCWFAADQDLLGSHWGMTDRQSIRSFPQVVCGFSAWCHKWHTSYTRRPPSFEGSRAHQSDRFCIWNWLHVKYLIPIIMISCGMILYLLSITMQSV